MPLGLSSSDLHFRGSSTFCLIMQTGDYLHHEDKHLVDICYAPVCTDAAVSEGGGVREKMVMISLSNL